MALDPNIILQGRQIQLDSPMDSYAKALTLKELAAKQQATEKAQAEQSTMNDILKRSTTVGPNGQINVDRGMALSEIAGKVNPQKALEYKKLLDSYDLDQLDHITKTSKAFAFSVTPENYTETVQKMRQMGLPNADKFPDVYSPQFVQRWQVGTLEGEKQVEQRWKEKEFALKETAASLEAQKTKAETAKIKTESGTSGGTPKMTEAQSKALGFGRRAIISDQIVNRIMSDPNADITSLKTQLTSDLPKWMGSLKNPQEQALKIAKAGFIASVLRKESGAAVTPQEFNTYDSIYFPQPGDNEQSLADKQKLRANFIDTEKMTAGNAWRDPVGGSAKTNAEGNQQAAAPKIFKTKDIEWK
jgi:hypothetical protein